MSLRAIRFLTLCLLVLWSASAGAQRDTWTADNGNGTFTNPLFYD